MPAGRGPILTLVVFIILLATPVQAADIVTGLVGHWKLDGNAKDYSGKGIDGTIHGATAATDRFGRATAAMSFDPASSQYVSIPSSTALVVNTGSPGVWIKGGAQTYGNARVVEIGISANRIGILMANATTSGSGGYLHLFTNFAPFSRDVASSSSTYNDNEWHHVVGTWDSSHAYLYVDGMLQGTFTGNAVLSLPSPIAGSIGNFVGGGTYLWKGSIDDVRIYNRALTQTDVTALYNNGGPTKIRGTIIGNAVIR